MGNTKKHLSVEAEYFRDFHCLMSKCRSNCCQYDWRIYVTRPDYNRIRSAKKSPELEKLVERGLVRNKRATDDMRYAKMEIGQDGACAFLDEKKLCRLQIGCGGGVLPLVCRVFPRRTLVMPGLVERSCSPACEEVVQLLWKLPDGLKFLCEMADKGVSGGVWFNEIPEQPGLYRRVFDIQTLCVDLLQNRAYSLDGRVILLGMAMKALAEIEATEDDREIDAWLARYRAFTQGNSFQETVDQLPRDPVKFLSHNLVACREVFAESAAGYSAFVGRAVERLELQPDEKEDISVNSGLYQEAWAQLDSFLAGETFLLENILVNQWFHDVSPLGSNGVWMGYMRFCALYSLLKFLLAGGAHLNMTKEDVVQTVVFWSRELSHNELRLEYLLRQLQENQCDTLAHMSILVNG